MSSNQTNDDDGVKNLKKHKNEENAKKSKQGIEAADKNEDSRIDDSSNEGRKKPKMMKNGLKDRHFLSWIRILSVTAVWWGFVLGFVCLCFFLMNLIIYPSDDSQPYFARSFQKYPGILNQPSLNIMCLTPEKTKESCNTNELVIRVNKIFNFRPDPLTKDERPKELNDKLAILGVADIVEDNQVYVTCEGGNQEAKDNLKGMKIRTNNTGDTAGIPVSGFPWIDVKSSQWPQVIFDLNNTEVVKQKKEKTKVVMECKAWANNIEREDRHVDKRTPRGGVLAEFCFKKGNIVKTEDCD